MRSARSAADWERAAGDLAASSGIAAELLERHGPPSGISPTPVSARFLSLVRVITYQQLSGRAAGTIYGRLLDSLDNELTPERLCSRSVEDLRAVGLSNAKVRSLLDLSAKVSDGSVLLTKLGRLPDAAVVEHLTTVRGVGPWTAQMFLMFDLGRTDVWPVGDLAVRSGFARIHATDTPPTEREMAALGDGFAPYRSVMAWWCWAEIDGDDTGPW
jgi:3-methyladenine DNA glycosylase/8-oxoguanine DNA glycosylase